MDKWLHVYYVGYSGKSPHMKQVWAYRRAGASRPLLKSTNKGWVISNAEFFARKHCLLLFIHQFNDHVAEHRDHRSVHMNVSKDFKTHYNETMTNNLVREIPNLGQSANVKNLSVRAVFKDKEEPLHSNVIVLLHNGQKVKFRREARYLFPTPELIAKIGLLI